jgi:hypothetical protein
MLEERTGTAGFKESILTKRGARVLRPPSQEHGKGRDKEAATGASESGPYELGTKSRRDALRAQGKPALPVSRTSLGLQGCGARPLWDLWLARVWRRRSTLCPLCLGGSRECRRRIRG